MTRLLFFFVAKCDRIELVLLRVVEENIDVIEAKEVHQMAIGLTHQASQSSALSNMRDQRDGVLFFVCHQLLLVQKHDIFKGKLDTLTYSLQGKDVASIEFEFLLLDLACTCFAGCIRLRLSLLIEFSLYDERW